MTNPSELLHSTMLEVGGLRQRVDALGSDQNAMGEHLATLLSDVKELNGNVESLTAAVSRLQGKDEKKDKDEKDPSRLVDWSSLSDEQRADEMESLRTWVADEFVPTYSVSLNQLSACWQLHHRAVVELSWLCSMWHAVYKATPPASPTYAGDWHSRYLRSALKALEGEWAGAGCTTGTHVDRVRGQEYVLPEEVRLTDPTAAKATLSTRSRWVSPAATLEPSRRR